MGRNLSLRLSMKQRMIRAAIIGVTVSACLGQIFLLPDVSDAYEKIDEAERRIERYPPLHSSFLPMMNVYEIGKYHTDLSEENCQAGFPPGCLLRGLIALEHGEPGSDPDENRKLAEKFFWQGCANLREGGLSHGPQLRHQGLRHEGLPRCSLQGGPELPIPEACSGKAGRNS